MALFQCVCVSSDVSICFSMCVYTLVVQNPEYRVVVLSMYLPRARQILCKVLYTFVTLLNINKSSSCTLASFSGLLLLRVFLILTIFFK